MDGLKLTTDENKRIIDELNLRIHEYICNCPEKEASSTFTPYYDVTLNESQKGQLEEVRVSSLIIDKVKSE